LAAPAITAIVYGIIAKRIIEAAKKGERDPIRLRDAGLAALGYKSDIG
jgi:type III secretion system FlhB-like substrate exporter